MTPRLVVEPITGCSLMATRPAHVWLAWLPCGLVVVAGGVGFVLGRISWAFWW